MDSKQTYETCATIAEALHPIQREVFANALIRLKAGRTPPQGTFAALSRSLPDGIRPMLLPLVGLLRTREDAPRRAVRQWLRDAGWL